MEKEFVISQERLEEIAEILFNSAFSVWSAGIKTFNISILDELNNPKIGDFVVEITNPFVPRLHALGKLIEVSDDGWAYKIERLDGVIHEWTNAKFVKVADKNTIKLLNRI